jgi:hypothetical protein
MDKKEIEKLLPKTWQMIREIYLKDEEVEKNSKSKN